MIYNFKSVPNKTLDIKEYICTKKNMPEVKYLDFRQELNALILKYFLYINFYKYFKTYTY